MRTIVGRRRRLERCRGCPLQPDPSSPYSCPNSPPPSPLGCQKDAHFLGSPAKDLIARVISFSCVLDPRGFGTSRRFLVRDLDVCYRNSQLYDSDVYVRPMATICPS